MAELKGSININKNIETCYELFDFSEDNMKKIDNTILFHTLKNKTDNNIGNTYLQGRDDNGNILEVEVTITDFINQEDYKKISAAFHIENFFDVSYTYELNKIDDETTEFTYNTKTAPTKLFIKILYKVLRVSRKYNINNFLEHIKNLIENEK